MAKMIVVSVRDVKAERYLGITLVEKQVEAQRHFLMLLREPKSPMHAFPRDYQIHEVGQFDTFTGEMEGLTTKGDLTPYHLVDEYVAKTERDAEEDRKLSEGMRQAVEYYRNVDNPRKDRVVK